MIHEQKEDAGTDHTTGLWSIGAGITLGWDSETGGSVYFDEDWDYQGYTVRQEFYGGAGGARVYSGYEWGFDGMEGRGAYGGARALGANVEFAQNGGWSYGGRGYLNFATYDSDKHASGLSKAAITKAIELQNSCDGCEVFFSELGGPVMVYRDPNNNNEFPDPMTVLPEGSKVIAHTHGYEHKLGPSIDDGKSAYKHQEKTFIMVNAKTKVVYLFNGRKDPWANYPDPTAHTAPNARVVKMWMASERYGVHFDLYWKK